MSRTVRRAGIAIAAAVALAATLSACSVRNPTQESLETAIPKALLAADLGITSAEADTSTDGFAVNINASMEFEADDVTAEDLRTVLKIVVDNANITKASNVKVTAAVDPFTNGVYIDLGALGEELGFSTGGDETFSATWNDVVDFVNE